MGYPATRRPLPTACRTAGRRRRAAGPVVGRPRPDHLSLEASAADAESLAVVEDVLGRHLERFGARRELAVTWQREA